MKILLSSPIGKAGGIARWTEHILDYYNRNLDNGECALYHLPMTSVHSKNAVSLSLIQRIFRGISTYREVCKQEKIRLRNEDYDVIHIASSASISLTKDIRMIQIAHKRKVKTIVHFHFGRIPELKKLNNWEWKLLCRVVRLSDAVVVIDKMSYDALMSAGFTNVKLLPNPISDKILNIVALYNNGTRCKGNILFVGHGVRTKGVFELIDACRNIPNIKVKMLGTITDSMRKELEEYAGSAEWLDICGEIPYENVIKEMLQCDVFVLPTYTEGFPNVILESMACGCPIVTTSVGAIPEMLGEEDNKPYGIMVEPRNVEQLQQAIERMLSDLEFKRLCSQNVRERVNERYNMSSVWQQMKDIWQQV